MALRNATPALYTAQSVSDAVDSVLAFEGAMVSLTNLIPDAGSTGLWQCRPAATRLTPFTGFSSPGAISCMLVVGVYAYGMIATSRFAGQDEPFAYNIITGSFTTITGPTAANTPVSPATTGAWTPPVMAQIGANIVVTHPGFQVGAGVYIGLLNITNPAAPTWTAGNTTGAITLTKLPTSVAQFNGRAWIAVGNTIYYSDTTNPLNFTSANQSVTVGINQNVVALAGLPLTSAVQGGVIQGLIAFVDNATMYQITGDAVTSNLYLNQMNVAATTYSQNTVTPTPQGLWFLSYEGLRVVDFLGKVSDPIATAGQGVNRPFLYSLVPSRMTLAYSADTIRISTQNGYKPGAPYEEYWYHLSRKVWSGPHTFPASIIQPYAGSFIMAPANVTGSLWLSNALPGLTNTYVENSMQLTWAWQTPLLPDKGWMAELSLSEAAIYLALNNVDQYTFTYLDEQGTAIVSPIVIAGAGAPTVWGAFTWGAAPWLGVSQNYSSQRLSPTAPPVFKRMSIMGTGPSSGPFRIGRWEGRLQQLGYMQQ